MNQSVIERTVLKKYNDQQALIKAARGVVPDKKDLANCAANQRLAVAFKWGYPIKL